jgi:type 1 glutamine amidotransferase
VTAGTHVGPVRPSGLLATVEGSHSSAEALDVSTTQAMGRILLLGLALSCTSTTTEGAQERSILVFSKTAAYRHASIAPGVAALSARATEAGVGLDATEDAAAFTPENLARYGAVVFLSTTGDVLGPAQEEALEGFIHAGGGFVGIHSASDTEYDWPWYGELVGAYFDGHPPGIHGATLHVANADHPATESLPDPWMRVDEWYDLRDMQQGVSVLLEIDETSYKSPDESPEPEPRPIAWYREFDGGRTFYTALGHTSESYADVRFLDHVWGGVTWVLGG